MGWDLVIFDCDGVLIESEAVACEVEAAALTRAGYPVTATAIMDRFLGLSMAKMFSLIEAEMGRPLPAGFAEALEEETRQAMRQRLTAVAGVERAIGAAPRRCVASSSRPERLEFSLGLVGLYDRFLPHVYSSTMVARGKPAPDLFLHAASRLGADPRRCAVIEDSPNGIRAARAAGMTAIGFSGGRHCRPGHAGKLAAAGAELLCADMEQVARLLLS